MDNLGRFVCVAYCVLCTVENRKSKMTMAVQLDENAWKMKDNGLPSCIAFTSFNNLLVYVIMLALPYGENTFSFLMREKEPLVLVVLCSSYELITNLESVVIPKILSTLVVHRLRRRWKKNCKEHTGCPQFQTPLTFSLLL